MRSWKSFKEEQKNKETKSESKEKFDVRKAFEIDEFIYNLPSKLKSLSAQSQEVYSSYKSRFFDENNEFKNTYRSDTEDALNKYTAFKSKFDTESQEILSYLDKYGSHLDAENVKNIRTWITDSSKNYEDILSTYQGDYDTLSGFKNEDEYKVAVKEQEIIDSMPTADLDALNSELSALKLDLNTANKLQDRLNSFKNAKVYGTPEQKRYETQLGDLLSKNGYSSIDEFEKVVSQKTSYYNRAKVIQDAKKLESNATSDENFEIYAQKGEEMGENISYGGWMTGNTYDNYVAYLRKSPSRLSAIEAQAINGIRPEDNPSYVAAKYMTNDEFKIYNSYIGKGDKEGAQKYLDSLKDAFNQRMGTEIAENMENDAQRILFSLEAGVDQFTSGLSSLFSNKNDYIAPSAIQYASGQVRRDLAKSGPEIFGSSLGQIGYDLGSTSANMLPSILTSVAVGMVSKTAGAAVGSALMGASAAGNAYQEALNLGYDKGQARTYSTLVGGSEAALSYALSGIGKLGGKVSGNVISKAVSGVDNALARFALNYGGKLASEALEEGLQEVLDPVFKNLVIHADEDIDWEQVAYSALLGAMSAGVFETTSSIKTEVDTYKDGKGIINDGQTDALVEFGKSLPSDSTAYRLANKINENTGAYTIGRLLYEVGADSLSSANISDISKSLRRKGFSAESAKEISGWLNKAVRGEKLSKSQRKILEENESIGQVFRNIVFNKYSTVNQRMSRLNSITGEYIEHGVDLDSLPTSESVARNVEARNVAKNAFMAARAREHIGGIDFVGQKISEFANSVNTQRELEARTENVIESKFEVSEDGQAYNKKTEQTVEVSEIASIKDGIMKLKLDNGEIVDAEDIELGTEDDAIIYSAVLDMGVDAAIANSLIRGYDPKGEVTATQYALGVQEAHMYGFYGISKSEMNSGFSAKLTPEQQSLAYDLGKTSRNLADSKQSVGASSKGNRNGSIRFNGNRRSLTERQRVSLNALEKLAKATGIDFYIFESWVNKKGVRVYRAKDGSIKPAPNGFFDPSDNSIHIDLNAGNTARGTILFTASHELVHFIRKWSPAKFRALSDFLMQQYGEKGVSVSTLVKRQRKKAADHGRGDIGFDAAWEEVVADSMETMLSDGNVMEKLELLKTKDRSLFQKIKQFFKDFAAKIKAAYNGMDPETAEGKYVSEMNDAISEIQSLFAEGIFDASENFAGADIQAQKNTTQEGDVMYQVRETEDGLKYVFLDKDIFIDESGNELTPRQAYNALVGQKITLEDGDTITFVKRLPGNRDIYNELFRKYPAFRGDVDIKAISDSINKNIEDSIAASNVTKRNEPQKHNHLGVVDFDKRDVYVTDGNNIYRLTLSIANLTDGAKIAYAKSFIEPASDDIQNKIKKAETVRKSRLNQLSNNKIPQKEPVVNTYSMQESKNNSEKHSDRDMNGDVKKTDRNFVEYNKPITLEDVQTLRSIGRKSINDFSHEDIVKSQKWAYKFYQQLGTKSPFFRAWFGDWREYEHLKFVDILQMEYREGKNPRGEYKNKDTGWIINSSSVGYDETVSHSGKDKKSIIAMRNIDKIIENAILLDTEVSEYGRGKKSIYTSFMHKFYAPIRISNKIYVAKMAVEESYAPGKADTNKKFYHVRTIEIETVSSVGIGKNHTPIMEDTVSNISISKLFAFVKRCDPEFKPRPASKVLLNEDGTPKTFYHGTNEEFDTFSLDELSSREGSFFFAENREDARGYGDNVFEVYLTGNKFADYDNQPAEFYRLRDKRKQVEYLKERGYDGWFADMESDGWGEISVFSNTQIKSATDNIGTFDGGNPNIHYSDRDSSAISNRSLLADALESAAQSDIEKSKLREYKSKIEEMDKQSQKLSDLRREIKELSFSKGPRDKAKLRALQDEAIKTANRIDLFDKQLLRLEAAKPLQSVLEREKQKAVKRQKAKDAEILKEYKEKSIAKIEETKKHYQESRKKNVEGRHKTEIRHKIKRVVGELNKLLLNPTKERHVPEELRAAVAEALDVVNMDTVGAEERAAVLDVKISEATDPDIIESLIEKRDRILNQDAKLKEKLTKLKDAYDTIRKSNDAEVKSIFDEAIYGRIEEVQELVGNTSIRNMSMEQLEGVYDLYTAVLTTVRDVNKTFSENLKMTRRELGSAILDEIKSNNKSREYIKHEGVEGLAWKYLKPMQAIKTIGSDTLQKLWNNILYGQETFARDYDEAVKFALELKEKYGYKKWDLEKTYSFKSKSGKVMKVNLEQMMSLYAYSKRTQADEHISKGGVLLNESFTKEKNRLGKVVKVSINDPSAYRFDKLQLAEIVRTMEKDAPGITTFVDEMQKYLSEVMGDKGNEVSMKMYGIRIFKEEHYFPLRSSQEFLESENAKIKGEVKIKNKSMTQATVKHANNPIVLENFLDVWGNHVNEMSMYHGLVLPLEDFTRALNYGVRANEELNIDAESVKTALRGAFGKNAINYLNELENAINGGILHDSSEDGVSSLISRFKKAKVMASMSVVIQQPTAIVRAMGIVEPKYFIASKIGRLKHKQTWEELKKYCPTAIIKETGSFDTNMGHTIVDMIREDSTFTEKVGDILGRAPAFADETGWNMIWRALKEKVKAEQHLSGEELLEECGKQMTLIINETQVYDSVMSRNEYMRSKGIFNKMATAFMAEPTTVANMVYGAALDFKRGNKKAAGRAAAATLASVILNGLASSIVYALRDDDEDKTLLEKYTSSATTEIIDGINPLTYLPVVKDVYSLMQGYDVERTDLALIGDVIDSLENFGALLDPDEYEDLEGGEVAKHIYENIEPIISSICNMFGLPVENILRDAEAIIVNDNLSMSETMSEGIGLSIKEGWLNASPELLRKKLKGTKYDKLYQVANNGDTNYVQKAVADMVEEKTDAGKTNKEATSSVKSSFSSIYRKLYLDAFNKGNTDEANRIRKLLYATGLYGSLSQLDATLKKWRLEQEE